MSIDIDDIEVAQDVVDTSAYSAGKWTHKTHDAARASIVALKSFYDNQHNVCENYITREDKLTVFARTIMADASYALVEGLFPPLKDPQRMVDLWQFFEKVNIKRDDALELAPSLFDLYPETGQSDSREQVIKTVGRIMTFMFAALNKRCFFITKLGYIGVGPALARPGDRVVVFTGSETPLVLRHLGNNYCIIGDSYVHGVMYGELSTIKHETDARFLAIV